MTRAPLAAWRRLFAIGGAPAASHVTLSRAPSADRLLDPLARARVAHATSLEALARPVDVGALLSRVADAAYNTERPIADPSSTDVARRGKTTRPVLEPGDDRRLASTNSSSSPVLATSPRTRPPTAAPTETGSRRGRFAGPRALEPSAASATATRHTPTPTPHRFTKNVVAGAARAVVPPLAVELEGSSKSAHSLNVSPGAQLGASARVVLNAAVPDVDRLLALGAPTSAASTQGRSGPRATAAPTAPPASTRGAARLLSDAVDRASAAVAGVAAAAVGSITSPAVRESVRSATPNWGLDAAPADTARIAHTLAAASDDEHAGGFRGLAQRTLISTLGAREVQVRRIEPESRIASDLALDTLDDKVADSLARVLAREARRHGIDLAEARS